MLRPLVGRIIADVIISVSSPAKVLKALIIFTYRPSLHFTFSSGNPTYCLLITFVSVWRRRSVGSEGRENKCVIFCRPPMFSSRQMFAYMALELYAAHE